VPPDLAKGKYFAGKGIFHAANGRPIQGVFAAPHLKDLLILGLPSDSESSLSKRERFE